VRAQLQSTITLAAGTMLVAAIPVRAQSAPVISGDRIRADMEMLASDSFGGRKPGAPDEWTTINFLITRFAGAGLTQGAFNSWLQPVELVTRRMRSASLVVRGPDRKPVDLSDGVAFVGHGQSGGLSNAPVAWGGYPEAGMAGVADALVLYRDSDPPGTPQPAPTDALTRLATLVAAGAKGALIVVPDDAFPGRKAALESGITTLGSDPSLYVRGIISESAARRMVAIAGMSLDGLDPRPLPLRANAHARTDISSFTSRNVAGVLRGARLPSEYVMYTAHWDSFGMCRPGDADEICNGAIDNASGVAGMIELARAFAAGPRPDRSILFLATTAEEMGLAGSRQYARTPLVSLSNTVAEFNLDVIVLYDRGNSAGFVGAGLTNADSVFERLVGIQGRSLETGGLAKMVLRSSDAWSLLMAGVPSFILSGAIGSGSEGSKAFHAYLASRYHGPTDEYLASMPMGGAVEEVELLYAAGFYFATAGTGINFLPQSAFQRRQ
jgi:hypothetical protein